jgi:hypothetical protein
VEVIVAVVNRANRVIEHHKFTGSRCRIGRAYDNDVILNEPHVSALHAILEEDAKGQWWLHDCDSKNGIRSHRYHKLSELTEVYSGDEFQLGRVRLRFYRPDHPVREALDLGLTDSALNYFSRPVPFLLQIVFLLASLFLLEYNRFYDALEWKEFLPKLLVAPTLALFWASIWAVAGRLLRHEPRFIPQCVIAVFYVTVIEWLSPMLENLAYNRGDIGELKTISYLLHGVFFYILLTMNLRLATHMAGWVRRLTASGIAVGVVGCVSLIGFLARPDFISTPSYISALQPPEIRWQEARSLDHYLKDMDVIFEETEVGGESL